MTVTAAPTDHEKSNLRKSQVYISDDINNIMIEEDNAAVIDDDVLLDDDLSATIEWRPPIRPPRPPGKSTDSDSNYEGDIATETW